VHHHALAQPSVADLKRKSVVGGVAAVSAQGVRFVVQTATIMVLARLLSPQDFGLQGMVVMVTGFVTLFNFPINAAKWFISNEAGCNTRRQSALATPPRLVIRRVLPPSWLGDQQRYRP
jgi:hypothetical protein